MHLNAVLGLLVVVRAQLDVLNPLVDVFNRTARGLQPTTDKVRRHEYDIMYGQFLMPLQRSGRPIKMLEIGLGCDMKYGPGASVALWKALFPNIELWEAERDEDCVEKQRREGNLEGFHVLTGDQGDPDTVKRWIELSGGNFDVIIDDGGHRNRQILTSFRILWPQLRPGGLYFLEDLQVGRRDGDKNRNAPAVADVVKSWIDQLLVYPADSDHTYPIPAHVESIFCQLEACVITKRAPHSTWAHIETLRHQAGEFNRWRSWYPRPLPREEERCKCPKRTGSPARGPHVEAGRGERRRRISTDGLQS